MHHHLYFSHPHTVGIASMSYHNGDLHNLVQGYTSPYKIYDDVIVQKEEEKVDPMKKTFYHYSKTSGLSTAYDTKDAAIAAGKKVMDSYAKAYGYNNDYTILEAVACITFPVPTFEVVDIPATTTA